MPKKTIRQVLEECAGELMGLPGVVGTAQTLRDGEPCIMVMVAARTPEIDEKIPARIEGYPVRIQVTGEFRARFSLKAGFLYRPVDGSCRINLRTESIGNTRWT